MMPSKTCRAMLSVAAKSAGSPEVHTHLKKAIHAYFYTQHAEEKRFAGMQIQSLINSLLYSEPDACLVIDFKTVAWE